MSSAEKITKSFIHPIMVALGRSTTVNRKFPSRVMMITSSPAIAALRIFGNSRKSVLRFVCISLFARQYVKCREISEQSSVLPLQHLEKHDIPDGWGAGEYHAEAVEADAAGVFGVIFGVRPEWR
jgi:hypothetical protein